MSEHCYYWRWDQARCLDSPVQHYGSLAPSNLFSPKLVIIFFLCAWSLGSSNRNGATLRQFSLSCRRSHLAPYSRKWAFVLLWHGCPEGRAQTFLISRSIHTFIPHLATPFQVCLNVIFTIPFLCYFIYNRNSYFKRLLFFLGYSYLNIHFNG